MVEQARRGLCELCLNCGQKRVQGEHLGRAAQVSVLLAVGHFSPLLSVQPLKPLEQLRQLKLRKPPVQPLERLEQITQLKSLNPVYPLINLRIPVLPARPLEHLRPLQSLIKLQTSPDSAPLTCGNCNAALRVTALGAAVRTVPPRQSAGQADPLAQRSRLPAPAAGASGSAVATLRRAGAAAAVAAAPARF